MRGRQDEAARERSGCAGRVLLEAREERGRRGGAGSLFREKGGELVLSF